MFLLAGHFCFVYGVSQIQFIKPLRPFRVENGQTPRENGQTPRGRGEGGKWPDSKRKPTRTGLSNTMLPTGNAVRNSPSNCPLNFQSGDNFYRVHDWESEINIRWKTLRKQPVGDHVGYCGKVPIPSLPHREGLEA